MTQAVAALCKEVAMTGQLVQQQGAQPAAAPTAAAPASANWLWLCAAAPLAGPARRRINCLIYIKK